MRHASIMRALAAGVVVAGLLALAGCQTKVVTTEGATPLNTVTSSGNGKVSAAPTEAEMNFGVVTRDAKADAALDAANKAAKTIADAVKKAGVADEDIQTANVSVYPEYGNQLEGKAPEITGYNANISVRVKIRDIEKVGDVIAAASGAGANEINGPTFTLGDDAPERDAAIEDAIDDAKHRAEVMAKAAGKSVGGIIAISESGVVAAPYYGGIAERAALADSIAIEPGQLDVTANVTVVFELK